MKSSGAISYSTDSGSATPSGDVLNVLGGTGVSTSAATNVVTIDLDDPATVAVGGTSSTSLSDGQVLLGNGTGALSTLDMSAKGSILVGDGVTDPLALAVGSDTQVLTADSSEESGVKWAPGPGTLTLLSSVTASTSSTLEFNQYIDSTYNDYVFIFDNILISDDAAVIEVRTSSDSGVSFDSGSSDYSWTQYLNIISINQATAAEISLSPGLGNQTETPTIVGRLNLFNPSNSALYTAMLGSFGVWDDTDIFYKLDSAGGRLETAIVDGMQFYPSAGTFVSGSIRMYGLTKIV